MAKKPGKKDTAPRSTVPVHKREVFRVSKKMPARPRTSPDSTLKVSKPKRVTKEASMLAQVVVTKKAATESDGPKKRVAKTKLIKSIYQGHSFPSDEVVREADLQRTRRRATAVLPHENIPEILSAEKAVTLPTAVNERLLSKHRALSEWYRSKFPRQVGRLLSLAGFGFVVMGALGLVPFVRAAYPNWTLFQRALVCEVSWCDDFVGEDKVSPQLVDVIAAQTPKAAVTFLTPPAEKIAATSSLMVRAEYVADVRVLVERKETGELFTLAFAGGPAGSDYKALIDASTLPPGSYQVRVEAKATRDLTKVWFSGPSFEIVTTDGDDLVELNTTDSDIYQAVSEGTTTPVVDPTVDRESPGDTQSIKGSLNYVLAGNKLIITVTASTSQRIELYAERKNATKPLFLGAAKRGEEGRWHLEYDLNNLPHGVYELVAADQSGAKLTEVGRLMFGHDAKAPFTTGTTTAGVKGTTEALMKLTEEANGFPNRADYLSALQTEISLGNEVWVLLADDKLLLNSLLLRYASVVSSNDEALVALARRSMNDELDTLSAKAALDLESPYTYMTWRQKINDVWKIIEVKIDGYEQKLASRSGRSSLNDTDADGLSDYDEFTYYGTDIFSADSDADGVTDGVEVVRGFDPSNSYSNVITSYESPLLSGGVASDWLEITGVLPVVETDLARGTPAVSAEITGKAPPHSLVTLFVFSEPVVVTARADESGSFVYRLDKSLLDGEHTVFATLLDNTGAIVTKSEPYQFTKTHEFFRVSGNENAAAVTASDSWSPTSSQLANIIIALCVMILGLGSLLTAYRLRMAQEDKETTTRSLAITDEIPEVSKIV